MRQMVAIVRFTSEHWKQWSCLVFCVWKRLTDKVRSRVAQFFEQELKACAAELGGPAKQWPARYDFSLLVFVMQLADDFDILFWCDFVA